MLPPSRTLKSDTTWGGVFMPRKSKIDPVEKVKIVEKVIRGEIGLEEAAKKSHVYDTTIEKWISIYQSYGPSGLLDQAQNKSYSKELKLSAVNDYLSGKGGYLSISQKYGLRSPTQLRRWVKAYNTHGEIKARGSGGGSYMRKARQTTYEERLSIVKECLENDKNYGAMAKKYNCSYQQVRNWVKRYEEMGDAGLEDRRGRRAGSMPSRTPEEELRDKIAELERKNKDLQMENDLLKKVRELEMKDRYL